MAAAGSCCPVPHLRLEAGSALSPPGSAAWWLLGVPSPRAVPGLSAAAGAAPATSPLQALPGEAAHQAGEHKAGADPVPSCPTEMGQGRLGPPHPAPCRAAGSLPNPTQGAGWGRGESLPTRPSRDQTHSKRSETTGSIRRGRYRLRSPPPCLGRALPLPRAGRSPERHRTPPQPSPAQDTSQAAAGTRRPLCDVQAAPAGAALSGRRWVLLGAAVLALSVGVGTSLLLQPHPGVHAAAAHQVLMPVGTRSVRLLAELGGWREAATRAGGPHLPRSTTRPSLSTRIWSAPTTVESLRGQERPWTKGPVSGPAPSTPLCP